MWPLSDITERLFTRYRLHAASPGATKDFYTTLFFFHTSSPQVQKLVALSFNFRHEGDMTAIHLRVKVNDHWHFVSNWRLGESSVTVWAHPTFPSDRLIDELISQQPASCLLLLQIITNQWVLSFQHCGDIIPRFLASSRCIWSSRAQIPF